MKVLLINHFPLEGSGSGIYTRNLAEELHSLGNEVMVIYPEHYKTEYESFKSLPIVFKSEAYNKDDAIDLDFDFPCFTSHPRSNNTFYNLSENQIAQYIEAFVVATRQAIDSFHPDVIHAQHLWLTPYVASQFEVPYVITAHGTDLKGFVKDERYHTYALKGAEMAEKVITISKQVDEDVKRLLSVPNAKREIILNGYNPDLFRVKALDAQTILEHYAIPYNGERIVFFAGKLAHFKGVDILLRATAQIEKVHKGGVLTLIAGHGELYDELIHLKNQLGLEKTHFLGHIYQEELVDLYNIANVSCVPSRTEPFGLVAIEALACGAPVVGSNQGGLPDFIKPDVGALVPPEDHTALAEGIIEMLERNSTFDMREHCQKYAKENFSRSISVRRVEQIYKEVLKR